MNSPRMYYFGPWDRAGHYWHDENGRSDYGIEKIVPWGYEIDGGMQPGHSPDRKRVWQRTRPEVEGEALLHHKDGWTAICLWDRSVDTRGACNSSYVAEGIFTFDQMVEMARSRFAYRWNKMSFEVRLVAD